MNKLEKGLQDEVIKYLKECRIWHLRTQMGAKSGLPDLILCLRGIFIGIELKRPDGLGKPSEQQLIVRGSIQRAGGDYYFVSSLDELKEALDESIRMHTPTGVR